MDTIERIGQLATPERLSRIANLIGGSPDQAREGLRAAVPAVLGGILAAGSEPGGAQALGHALERAAGLDARAGTDPAGVATAGSDMVASILGGRGAGVLAHVARPPCRADRRRRRLAPRRGGGDGAGRARRGAAEKGLDATGVLELLAAQKRTIAHALPRDIAIDLGGAGVLADLAASAPMRAIAKPLRAVNPVPRLPQGAPPRSGSLRWVLWVVLVAVVTLIAARLLAPAPTTETTAAPVPAVTAPAPNPLIVTGVNIGTTVGNALETITTTLATIRDAPSAQGALPRLMAARDQLNSVEDNVNSLTDAGHTALRQMLGGGAAGAPRAGRPGAATSTAPRTR